jgi:hypothetical protein
MTSPIPEAHARLLWCPFARQEAGEAGGGINRVGGRSVPQKDPATGEWMKNGAGGYVYKITPPEPAANCLCLGAQCMAWVVVENSTRSSGYCALIHKGAGA